MPDFNLSAKPAIKAVTYEVIHHSPAYSGEKTISVQMAIV